MGRTSTSTIHPTVNHHAGTDLLLKNALKAQLLDLPFAALAACAADLLQAEGYTNIRLAGRTSYRGHNKEGGYDLEAYLPSPLGHEATGNSGVLRRRVLVQIKQFPPHVKVYQRTLDALRGACLRTGAIEAVLLTTSDFSPLVRNVECTLRREAGGSSLAPVHLLNGDALVERLIRHRIGVQEDAVSAPCLSLDADYFARLMKRGQTVAGTAPEPPPKDRQLTGQPSVQARLSRTRTEVTLTLPLTLFTGKGGV